MGWYNLGWVGGWVGGFLICWLVVRFRICALVGEWMGFLVGGHEMTFWDVSPRASIFILAKHGYD